MDDKSNYDSMEYRLQIQHECMNENPNYILKYFINRLNHNNKQNDLDIALVYQQIDEIKMRFIH